MSREIKERIEAELRLQEQSNSKGGQRMNQFARQNRMSDVIVEDLRSKVEVMREGGWPIESAHADVERLCAKMNVEYEPEGRLLVEHVYSTANEAKGASDAVQVEGAGEVDVREQTGDGEGVGTGDAETVGAAGTESGTEEEHSEAGEEAVSAEPTDEAAALGSTKSSKRVRK